MLICNLYNIAGVIVAGVLNTLHINVLKSYRNYILCMYKRSYKVKIYFQCKRFVCPCAMCPTYNLNRRINEKKKSFIKIRIHSIDFGAIRGQGCGVKANFSIGKETRCEHQKGEGEHQIATQQVAGTQAVYIIANNVTMRSR